VESRKQKAEARGQKDEPASPEAIAVRKGNGAMGRSGSVALCDLLFRVTRMNKMGKGGKWAQIRLAGSPRWIAPNCTKLRSKHNNAVVRVVGGDVPIRRPTDHFCTAQG
jgi:hypothetical protein